MTTTESDTTLEWIPLDAIKPNPGNVRRQIGDISELTASIKTFGLLQPPVVAPGKKPGSWVLIIGHRRRVAARKAGLDKVLCRVRHDLLEERDQVAAMLTENLQRTGLSAIEEGDAYTRLLELDLDVRGIAATTGRAQKTIRERVKVAKAPDSVRDRVHRHELNFEDALTLQSFAGEPEYSTLEDAIGTANWLWEVQRAKDKVTQRKKLAKLRATLVAEGYIVVDHAHQVRERRAALARETGEAWTTAGVETFTDLEARPDGQTPDRVIAHIVAAGTTSLEVRWYVLECKEPTDTETPDTAAQLHTDHAHVAPDAVSGDTAADPPVEDQPAEIPPAADEADDARRAAAEQLDDDLETAQRVRRDHLVKVARAGDADVAREALLAQIRSFLTVDADSDQYALVARCTGLSANEAADTVEGDDCYDSLVSRLERMSLEQLAITLRIASSEYADATLAAAHGWRFRVADVDAWIAELNDVYAYEWSDVEARMVDEIQASMTEDGAE